MRRLAPLLLIAALGVVTACGSSGGSSATSPTTASPDPADVRIAQAAVPGAADLPEGFLVNPGNLPDPDQLIAHLHACAGFPALTTVAAARAASPQFLQGSTGIEVLVRVYPSPAVPTRQITELQQPDMTKCLEAFGKGGLTPDGTDITKVVVAPITLDPVGDATVGYRSTLTLKGKDGESTVVVDQVTVRVGRMITTVRFTAETADDLAAIEAAVLPRVAELMQTALAG